MQCTGYELLNQNYREDWEDDGQHFSTRLLRETTLKLPICVESPTSTIVSATTFCTHLASRSCTSYH